MAVRAAFGPSTPPPPEDSRQKPVRSYPTRSQRGLGSCLLRLVAFRNSCSGTGGCVVLNGEAENHTCGCARWWGSAGARENQVFQKVLSEVGYFAGCSRAGAGVSRALESVCARACGRFVRCVRARACFRSRAGALGARDCADSVGRGYAALLGTRALAPCTHPSAPSTTVVYAHGLCTPRVHGSGAHSADFPYLARHSSSDVDLENGRMNSLLASVPL
jgi:hypothetical protein